MKPKIVKTNPSILHACSFCNYSTDKSANLSRHNKTMHETVKESIVCCGISFLNKADYREHNKSRHATGHACPVCGRKFSRRALLRRHLSVHTGYKEFKCEYCSYASSHKSNLSRHMKVHRYENQEQVIKSEIKLEPGYTVPSQPDSTTSPVLNNYNDHLSVCHPQQQQQYQHSHVIVKPFPILRSMLTPTFSSNSSEEMPCQPKLSHSIESILSRNDTRPNNTSKMDRFSSSNNVSSSNHDSQYQVSCTDEMVTSTTTTTLTHPLFSDEEETTSTTTTNTGMQVDVDTVWRIDPQVKDDKFNWSHINNNPFTLYNHTDSSLHKYNNYYNNNCFTCYDSSTSSVAGGYLSPACYSLDFFPTFGPTTTNAGPGQDSRILPSLHSPYAVSNSTASGYQTFQPRVLVFNTSPPPYNNDYELSPPGPCTDSVQQYSPFLPIEKKSYNIVSL